MFTQIKRKITPDSTPSSWLNQITCIALGLGAAAVLVFVLAWPYPRNNQYQQLRVGDIIPNDIVAPIRINYVSEVLTQQARERAMDATGPHYDPPESRVRRQQTSKAREIIEFITIVRSDPYASDESRTDYLSAIYELELSQEEILTLLSLSNEEWASVALEAPLALDRVMREEIHNTVGDMANARRGVNRLIGGDLSDQAMVIASGLVGDLIVPNSFINEERTNELRLETAEAVESIERSYEQGENVIRRNTKLTEEDLEAMEKLGFLRSEWSWWILVRAVLFAGTLLAAVAIALYRLVPEVLQNVPRLALLVITTASWLILAKFMVIPHPWLPYLYPLATLGMVIAVLIDLRVSLVLTLAFTIVMLYLNGSNTMLAIYLGMGSVFGALVLGRAERLTAFLWTGTAVGLSNFLVIAAFQLPDIEFTAIGQSILLLLINGILSASIALLGYFLLGNLFGITTSLQLTELSRPTHPLLRQLLLKSPGTYHHTIVVSNMAERAAAAIGADAMLTRVGAYYHDIGKTVRPYFFIENSAEGAESPHNKLDPYTSAQIILSHVTDGIDLAHKYRLPLRIQDFIREHHGRSVIKSFYIPAMEQAGRQGEEVDEEDFRYIGPSPRSKETAILMLADTCESAVRAIRPGSRRELTELLNQLIDSRVDEGELNHCNLTFQELQSVKEIFGQVLQGVHHPRVSYPGQETKETETTDALRVVQTPKVTTPASPAPVPDPVPVPASNGHAQNNLPPLPEHPVSEVIPSESNLRRRESAKRVPGGVEQPA
ncbi:MAG: HDIG domain-containing metalloprotein [Chloroflexota bacterium]